jgi:nitroimidazol reductase NimA-like FMN-containing flavoprotein (pyridoxamine 5'-phosphate oxidase superfamily)
MGDNPIDHLTADEAWNVVRTSQVGRIATMHGNAPEIHPVTHVVHGEHIYFRTGVRSRLLVDTENQLVAFEVTEFDHDLAERRVDRSGAEGGPDLRVGRELQLDEY